MDHLKKTLVSPWCLIANKRIEISEDELVGLLRRREPKGFEILYDNYSAALLGVIVQIVKSREIAEELLSETFVKVSISIHQYDASKGRLFTWLLNIARHLGIDKIRSKDFRNNRSNLDLDTQTAQIDRQLTTSINPSHSDLRAITAKLSATHRTLIDLAFFKGYTQSEIAEELNVPLGTVKTRMRKAISRLRSFFDYSQVQDISA